MNPTLSLLQQTKPIDFTSTGKQALKQAPMLQVPQRKAITVMKPPSFLDTYKSTLVDDITRQNALDGRYTTKSTSDNPYGVKEALWSKVAPLIDTYGLSVVQGYRDPDNLPANSKSAKNSQHFYGNAIDLNYGALDTLKRMELIKAAQQAGITGYGVGNNTLHLDIGPSRYWTYDKAGNWTSGLPSWARPLF